MNVATFKVRPRSAPAPAPTAWIAVAHHGEWVTIGAAASEEAALADLKAQLPGDIDVLTILDGPLSTEERDRLLWSAKSRALVVGTAIVETE